jgi:hypothetical protein
VTVWSGAYLVSRSDVMLLGVTSVGCCWMSVRSASNAPWLRWMLAIIASLMRTEITNITTWVTAQTMLLVWQWKEVGNVNMSWSWLLGHVVWNSGILRLSAFYVGEIYGCAFQECDFWSRKPEFDPRPIYGGFLADKMLLHTHFRLPTRGQKDLCSSGILRTVDF